MTRQKSGTRAGKEKEKINSLPKGTLVVERRKHPRVFVELPLNYRLADARESQAGMVVDASEGGILVYLKQRIDLGTLLKIEILFVKGLELSSICGIAKVVWSDLAARESFGELRYGLQFQSFDEGGLDKLKTVLREVGQPYGP